MSGGIGHLQIEVVSVDKVKVCGDVNLHYFMQKNVHELCNQSAVEIYTDYFPPFTIQETSITTRNPNYYGEPLKMEVVHILEDEDFQVISIVFDQRTGTEKLMMYKEA